MPKVSSRKKAICKVGDRIQAIGRVGVVTNVSYSNALPYEIRWENERFSYHKESDFSLYKFQILPSKPITEDVVKEEENLWNQSSLILANSHPIVTDTDGQLTADDHQAVLSLIEQGIGDTAQLSAKTGLGMSAIAQQLRELAQQGKIHRIDYQWKIKNLDSLTSAQGLALDSPLQDLSLEDLPLLAYANEKTIAETSSRRDTQECQLLETLSDMTGQTEIDTVESQTLTSSQPPLPASPSQSKGRGLEPTTSEIASPRSSRRSPKSNRRTSRSKTSEDSSAAPTDLVTKSDTLPESSPSFPSAGTMHNGKWSAADILEAPSLENDSFWLASPGALSSHVSRKAGQSKLERQLKDLEAIAPNENVNPIFLEDAFGIPLGFSDPLECQTALQLIAAEGKLLATPSIPELQPLLCAESSTSIPSEEELTPVDESAIGKHYWCDAYDVAVEVLSIRMWRVDGKLVKGADTRPWWTRGIPPSYCYGDSLVVPLDELVEIEEFSCPLPGFSLEQPQTHASKQIGSLYQYTKNKADKTGVIFTHPKIEGDRKREEDSHWYWGFSYVEKEKGKWKDKSASVSRPKLAAVREALREGKHYTYILQEILGKD